MDRLIRRSRPAGLAGATDFKAQWIVRTHAVWSLDDPMWSGVVKLKQERGYICGYRPSLGYRPIFSSLDPSNQIYHHFYICAWSSISSILATLPVDPYGFNSLISRITLHLTRHIKCLTIVVVRRRSCALSFLPAATSHIRIYCSVKPRTHLVTAIYKRLTWMFCSFFHDYSIRFKICLTKKNIMTLFNTIFLLFSTFISVH